MIRETGWLHYNENHVAEDDRVEIEENYGCQS